jgi:hypothetical protein
MRFGIPQTRQWGRQMSDWPATGPDKGSVGEIEGERIERDMTTYLDIKITRDLEIEHHFSTPTILRRTESRANEFRWRRTRIDVDGP